MECLFYEARNGSTLNGGSTTVPRNLRLVMLDAVYVDTVEEKSVRAIRPKPAFRPILEVASTRGGSVVVFINGTPPDPEGPQAESLCSWWRWVGILAKSMRLSLYKDAAEAPFPKLLRRVY